MKINLTEYFEETIAAYPDRIAVVEGEKSVTFEQLGRSAKGLAGKIISLDSELVNKPIAVFLPKSIESVYVDIAIVYSGNAYMNLDIKSPIARIQNILDLVKPGAFITNSKLLEAAKGLRLGDAVLITLEEGDPYPTQLSNSEIQTRVAQIIDTDPLCIINTSGSTGTPKGVVLNHRSFIDFTERSQELFRFSNEETIGSLSPLVFDIYSYELCLLMRNAATMLLIPDSLTAFPASILGLLQKHRVSFIFWVPTIMVNIANMDLLTSIKLPDLKLVWFAGEVFPTKQFNYWRKSMPSTRFANLYGPIEITLDCTLYIVERELRDDEPIPIGYAYKNTDVLILNDRNERAKPGEEGELCVRGTSLAMGYYNNPEKTAAAFVQNPLNHSYPEIIYRTGDLVFTNPLGEIIFKGRKDSLIKHMGYRIELGEIEHVIINTLHLVQNCCVVYNHRSKEITLYYEAEQELSPADFRKAIGHALPRYMVPVVYHRLPELRRNTNGKIDRLYYSKLVQE